MSQKVTRKSQNAAASEEKEKRQTDSPAKDMKKKMAANAEKEKQAEKADKPEKADKSADKTDKSAEKSNKSADKSEKSGEKSNKSEKSEKPAEKEKVEKKSDKVEKKTEKVEKIEKKTDKPVEKKQDKPAEKKLEQTEKKDEGRSEKNVKEIPEKSKAKHNGVENNTNGDGNGAGSSESSGSELMIDDDAVFPELAYLDRSDSEDEVPPQLRARTRRDQVKATKTPETPRPASEKDNDDPSSKVLKLNEAPPVSDRKLRSSDSPKPDKKPEASKAQEANKEQSDKKNDKDEKKQKEIEEDKKKQKEIEEDKRGSDNKNEKDIEVVMEVEGNEAECRVKTRARVSPYTRQAKHDQTITSVMADYTGNNTTMEMDITESSITEESPSASFLRGLKDIRGRASYRHHKQSLQQILANRSSTSLNNTSLGEIQSRPTAPVVGRKRKPEPESEPVETAVECLETLQPVNKRSRLFNTLAGTFRRSLPLTRNAEIVGINTDLPLTAPVASSSTFDPETLKTDSNISPISSVSPSVTTTPSQDKRCIVM